MMQPERESSVVTIDPEDRELVGRIVDHLHDGSPWWNDINQPTHTSLLQAALRTLLPIEEPTGLGAVVEDASQVEFIHLGSGMWVYGTTDGPSKGFAYADISAVRILSSGVTP